MADTAFEDTSYKSAAGDNAHLHWCEKMEQKRHYAACARLVDLHLAKLSFALCYSECQSLIERGQCPALAMRKEERAAKKPLYYVERPEKSERELSDVERAVKPVSLRNKQARNWSKRAPASGKWEKGSTVSGASTQPKKPADAPKKGVDKKEKASPVESQSDLAEALASEATRLNEEQEKPAPAPKAEAPRKGMARKKGESVLDYARRLKGNR